MKRLPKLLKLEELERLNTKRLLNYLKLLHQCEASFEESDQYEKSALDEADRIEFKESENWKLAYSRVKSILKKREHIEKNK